MSINKILDAALELREEGFAIHWLLPKTKKPFEDDWTKLPVKSTEVLKRQYRDNYNAGVRLGKPSKIGNSFLHVIDFDVRDIRKLDEAQKALDEILGDIKKENLSYVISGSGGESRHYYLLLDQPLNSKKLARTKEKIILEDGTEHLKWEIDLFGTGKQVVIPPSVHPSGGIYNWGKPFISDFEQTYSSEIFEKAYQRSENEDIDPDAVVLTNLGRRMNLSFEQAWDDLSNLDEDEWDHYDEWNKIGMACHFEFNGSEEGFRLFRDYSRQCKRHYFDKNGNPKPKEITEKDLAELDPFLEKKWHSYRKDIEKSEIVTWATIKKAVLSIETFDRCLKKVHECKNQNEAMRKAAEFDLNDAELYEISNEIKKIFSTKERKVSSVGVKSTIRSYIRERKAKERVEYDQSFIDYWIAEEVLAAFYTDKSKDKKILLKYFNKTFWHYRKGLYEEIETSIVKQKISNFIKQVSSVKPDSKNVAISTQLREAIIQENKSIVGSYIDSALNRLIEAVTEDRTDDPIGLGKPAGEAVFNCKNAEVIVDDAGIAERAHNPDEKHIVRLNVRYNAEAKCPKFDKMMLEIFSNSKNPEDVIRHFLEISAYIAQPTRWLQMIVMFIGKGSNGKSTVTSILSTLMGIKATLATELSTFSENDNHAIASLVGKHLIVDDDWKTGAEIPDSLFKKLENKMMTANPKYKDPFTFWNRAVPLICSNTYPRTRDSSYGMQRRVQIFRFDREFSEIEANPNLLNEIVDEELPGITNHLIAAYQRLLNRGRLLVPEDCLDAKNHWIKASNVFSAFMQDCVEYDQFSTVKGQDFWSKFVDYCNVNFIHSKETRNSLYEKLRGARGIKEVMVRGKPRFNGIKIRDDVNLNFDDLDQDESPV